MRSCQLTFNEAKFANIQNAKMCPWGEQETLHWIVMKKTNIAKE